MNKLSHQFTDKQFQIYKEIMKKDWFLCILYGAKRTGKTIFNNYMFLEEVLNVRERATKLGIRNPQYILAGYTLGTIQKNVLEELTNMYGLEFTFDKYNRFKLFGVTIVQTPHGNVKGLAAIRGMTAFGAYINEASLAHPSVFDEIKSRCSGEGARILSDTNPDNPEHWLLKDYIQNEDESIISYHFELDDNTFLSERYRKNIKATTPSGMMYDRNILGLWVSGDGLVYQDFDKKIHTMTQDELKQIPMKQYFAGVDWGYEHHGVIVVFGMGYDDRFYLIEEHAKQHVFIEDWVRIAHDIKVRYGDIPFYCDSARSEHVAKFDEEGINAIFADKRIMRGVELVAHYFKNDKLRILYDACPRFASEIYNYAWDTKKDLPIKEYDDVMDAMRYALLTFVETFEQRSVEDEIDLIQQLGI
ncbi:PBSX family phage terminase large subunit [Staphylococcus pseudintermedius]|uniref:PBSX family phage terminase large subunit n=1 Tax=Staphylococcus pseudintermedius TaxID=283734 RepID=UPI0019F1D3DF|nr:PBSX family phage terminase large subunit [Staphylococcus pseudintermedius]EGQ2685138.1 PBSX family phage terminase large subunit [Staphylococcus pseudintermedius]EGQ2726952.1 PBSX family phage terminase large subunit [Staphylococcus pseudintermedius]EGQ3054530.1 PBSX family phage terminase large subunit [Staphylococcus pseudintermedius]EGQ3591533.1 PBSX family phage terminase large subunit [Staphylococcus pseudintermedius]EGQ4429783.1 PBSX family phage terminase large subunit [Staphylococc